MIIELYEDFMKFYSYPILKYFLKKFTKNDIIAKYPQFFF
jgi:hypothetical protein